MSNLSVAIAITADAFKNRFDKGGKPYILHCLHVMNQMDKEDDELRCIAVMHDLIEDTDYEIEDLIALGFSDRVTRGIQLLTHDSKIPYMDYVTNLKSNDDARKIKMADLRHNSDITRMKGLREKDFKRLEKYHRAYSFLKD